MVVTVDGAKGIIYKGQIIFGKKTLASEISSDKVEKHYKTATKLYVNLAEPNLAFKVASQNVDGVGLLRAEFILSQIGKHPKQFLEEGKGLQFIEQLTNSISTFGKAFGKRSVIYRATDLKSNEYRNLAGGDKFEPKEANPMLGYRGAFRFIKNPDVFKLELAAIKKVRQKYPNIHLMIPYVRTVLEDFIKIGIDGISIGSNDLTMLILGTDRDNEEVASEFYELDDAVLWALERAIKTALKAGITSSICGQAPSVYPELTQKLINWGITSISVNPDAVESTRQIIYECEKKLLAKG
ncbi:MAG: Phosphoenolpyruvate synthase [Candidatus Curtissbacteria bacterium GW2011_GWA2_41_24]|uniref:Phosphoenolpyruvate synthase n=1 Tax=Candidatus Curtissbacteria bacterium GW2011_GWA2_41_24 TaxID=1618411 RepID=A0A0G0VZH5_9BACT|nr:MAG: Phosphoenolpyruvate synthase [Candidatus Curtissbacteria bacterium GW2011_GWA2_41_24]